MKLITTIAVVLLTGCGSPGKWVHPSGNQSRVEQDSAECEYEAQKATGNSETGFSRGVRRAQIEDSCMKVRGYEWWR